MTIKASDAADGTILEVRGCFDPEEADRLHEVLLGVKPETPVTVDFRAVRLFHDSAVARLARELGSNRQVSLLGLSEHHHRLLRYFGMPVVERPAGNAAHA